MVALPESAENALVLSVDKKPYVQPLSEPIELKT